MNLIKRIKNQSGVLVGIFIVVLLLAFILGSGGSSRFFSFLSQREADTVGSVAGKPISKYQYESQLKLVSKNHPASKGAEVENFIQEQAWNTLVQQIILQKELDDVGIVVSDRETVDIVQGAHVHPWIKSLSLFFDKKTNLFDKDILIEFLQDLSKRPKEERISWYRFERSIIESRKQEKFLDLLGKTFYRSSLDNQIYSALESAELIISYVYIPYSSFTGEIPTPTDGDVRAYMDRHKAVYNTGDALRVKYLTFKVEPTSEDVEEFMQSLSEICDGFSESKDDYAFAIKNTDGDTQSVRLTFNSQTVPAIFEEEDLRLGRVIGPVDFGDVYRIYKVINVQKKNGLNEYELIVIEKAQYISEASRNATYNYASKCAAACKTVADLEKWALEQAYPVEESYVEKNNTRLRGKENAREIIRWLFNNKLGHVSNVCEVGNSYVVAVAVETVGRGAASMDRYRDDIARKLQNESKAKSIIAMLTIDEASTIREISSSLKLENFLLENQRLTFATDFLPKAGSAMRAVGAAFDLKDGEMRIIADDYGVFVLKLVHKNTAPKENPREIQAMIERNQADMNVYSSLDAMLELSNVVDSRYKFY